MYQGSLTLQIADAKEQFLETALQLITPVVENGDEESCLLEDVEGLAQDTINMFAALQRCDEQHNLLAASVAEYPYQAVEEELADLFRRFLTVCENLYQVVTTLQSRGHKIESQPALETVCIHARRLVHDDETFYETETYRVLAERALSEYQTGQVEEWPV